jgi:hypothetical protein
MPDLNSIEIHPRFLAENLSEFRLGMLLDSVIHELLHTVQGQGDPSIDRHDYINVEAPRRSRELFRRYMQARRNTCP